MEGLGQLIEDGRAATEELWRAPDDPEVRARARRVVAELMARVHASGTPEMQAVCDHFSPTANAAPTPQAIEIMQAGLDQLRQLWRATRSEAF